MATERSLWQRGHTDTCPSDGCPCYIEGKTIVSIERAGELVRMGAALADIRVLLAQVAEVLEAAMVPDG